MCGRDGTGGPSWRTVTPSSYRAPASSSAETNWLDDDASITTSPPAHVPGAGDGERQRAASAVVDVDAQAAQRVEDPGHRPGARVRVTVEGDRAVGQRGDRWHEAHHRAGEAAVDGAAVQLGRA